MERNTIDDLIPLCRADLALDVAEMRETDDLELKRSIYLNVSVG